MDNKELKRIYSIELKGADAAIDRLSELRKVSELLKSQFLELKKDLQINKDNPEQVERITKAMAKLQVEMSKNAGNTRLAKRELEMLVSAQEKHQKSLMAEDAATKNAAGSINEAAAQYKALLAITKAVGKDSLINWKGENIGIDEAKVKLNEYKRTVDDFNRSLSSDGTLVGEYRKGIVNAFADMGLTDMLKDQKQLITMQLSELIDKNKTLIANFNEVGRSGPKGFARIPPELERNIQRAQELEAQLMDINDVLKNQGGIGTQVTKSLSTGFKNVITAGLGVVGVTVGLSQITNLLSKSFNVNTKLDSMNNALKLVSKTETELAKNQSFLIEETDRLGLELISTTTAFKSFYTASTESGIGANATREIFTAVASSAANLKLSQEDVNGVFTAFGQIASKGKVQAEELRGQIGERIPGAFSIAARAIGVTEQQLNKMMEKGEVVAQDFLPKFAAELQNTFGGDTSQRIDGLQASVNRFQNALTNLFQSEKSKAFYSAILSGATDVLNFFNQGEKSVQELGNEIASTAKQSDKYQATLGPLLSRYDELKNKTELSADEHVELQKIIDKITSIVPGAATEFNAYGRALDINKGKVLDFAAANDKLANSFKQTNLKQLETDALRAIELSNRAKKTLDQGFDEDVKIQGMAATQKVTKVDLFKDDGTYTSRGSSIYARMTGEAQRAIAAAKEIAKNGGIVDKTLLEFVKNKGDNTIEIIQKSTELNRQIEANRVAAQQAFLKGDEKQRIALAKKNEELTLELRKLTDPTAFDEPKKGGGGGLTEEEKERLARERERKQKEALDKSLRNVDMAYIEKQKELIKAGNLDKTITQQEFDKKMSEAQIEANDKKIAILKSSSVAEKSTIKELELENLNIRVEMYERDFEERKKALEKRRQAEIDAAQSAADVLLNDPEVSDLNKSQVEQDLANKKKDIQVQFNAEMDQLEKDFKVQSEENARARAQSLVDIEQAQKQAARKKAEAGFNEELTEIRAKETAEILKITQDLEAATAKILGSKLDPEQKAQQIEKLFRESNLRMLDSSINADTQELEIFQRMVDAKILKQEEFEQFSTELSKKRLERNKTEAEAEIEAQRRKEEVKQAIVNGSAALIDTFLQSMFDAQNARLEKENEVALQKLDNEKQQALSFAQSQAEKETIEKQFEARKKEQEKIAFEKKKEQRKKEILIEAAFGAAKAIAQNPPPSPIGLISAGFVFAQAAVQIASISKQKFEYGGMPKKGGKIGGNPHSAGGTPFTFGGEPYEAEVEELAIIRTRNAPRGRFNISGTHQEIASALNVIGGGVNFQPGARLRKFEYGGLLGDNLRAPVNPSSFLNNNNSESASRDELKAMMTTAIQMTAAVNSRIDRLEVLQDPRAAMKAQNKIVKNDSIGSL